MDEYKTSQSDKNVSNISEKLITEISGLTEELQKKNVEMTQTTGADMWTYKMRTNSHQDRREQENKPAETLQD